MLLYSLDCSNANMPFHIPKAKQKISVFRGMGLKILGRVGSHFPGKMYNFIHFERRKAFQNE